jgi:pyruvate-ferredoxin/flavodoxin oxidoreductase
MMQAEGGAAGALHGASALGTVSVSFTASQGLLLMIPDLYKIAGEYCPAVVHVTARSLATGGLSIYGDHSDVYAARMSGIPMMCSNSVQEAHDLSAISHLTTIKTGLPFLHFFDGFRTSHEVNTYYQLDHDTLRRMVDEDGLARTRARSMNPEHPHTRGTILGPEFVFQSMEKANPVYGALPYEVDKMMDTFGKLTGRHYKPFQYVGPHNAEYIIIAMGSGASVIEEYARTNPTGKVGVVKIHLFRPFSAQMFNSCIPASAKMICVLDKWRDPTGVREPLYTDVVAALHGKRSNVHIIGGRFGLGSKDFNPPHVEAIVKNMTSPRPKDGFTVGINAPETMLEIGGPIDPLPPSTTQCLFWGLGSDGTVGANREAIKMIVDNTDLYGQAYFAFSAHKSGGLTTSHLRFGKDPIDAPYLIQKADYIACHNPVYINKFDMLTPLKENGVVVLNMPKESDFEKDLPPSMRKKLAEKNAKLYRIDASHIAEELGLPGRINMIMQTIFFGLSGVLPAEQCIKLLKNSIENQYKKKGHEVVQKNWDMVDRALSGLSEVKYNREKWLKLTPEVQPIKEGFEKILQMQVQNRGEEVTVDMFTECAQIPPGTSKFEKRGIALNVPVWDEKKCIQCNTCAFLCPHSVLRPYLLTDSEVGGLKVLKAKGKELKGLNYRLQISPLDCTGCGMCVDACPVDALSMVPLKKVVDQEHKNFERLYALPNRGHLVPKDNVKNVAFQQPLLEFNGSCPGCGEPTMVKVLTQLYGDQLYIANATGCSIVWGATYPWNPYTTNARNHGPVWANSLFEDNAEFGYGMYHAIECRRDTTKKLINNVLESKEATGELEKLFRELLAKWNSEESIELAYKIQPILKAVPSPSADMKRIQSQADMLAKKALWIIGGDGWAYDIDFGGLDHVLASGDNVNFLVMDTEVYSNTGGQCSKATPRSAVANFSAAGYNKMKKDLGLILMTYSNIYVASTCMIADPAHALKCIHEASSYNGPSLIINYSPCISHGVKKGLGSTPTHCKKLVEDGYVVFYRFDPRREAEGKNPFQLDSPEPSFCIDALVKAETRYSSLNELYPDLAQIKQPQLVDDLKKRYQKYAKLAGKI